MSVTEATEAPNELGAIKNCLSWSTILIVADLVPYDEAPAITCETEIQLKNRSSRGSSSIDEGYCSSEAHEGDLKYRYSAAPNVFWSRGIPFPRRLLDNEEDRGRKKMEYCFRCGDTDHTTKNCIVFERKSLPRTSEEEWTVVDRELHASAACYGRFEI